MTLRVVNGKMLSVEMILMCSNTKGITNNKNLRNEYEGEIKSINYDQFKIRFYRVWSDKGSY